MMAESKGLMADAPNRMSLKNEVRIVLIGKTGCGKSATGNSLLGRDEFESKVGGSSVTSKCQFGSALYEHKALLVVDTPGLFDTNVDNEVASKEIVKCIGITAPGIHAVVLVTSIGRFTQEEQKTIEFFKENLGKDLMRYMIIVFTGKDDLVKGNQTLEEYVKGSPSILQALVAECENRIVAVDNTAPQEREEFRDKMMKMVEDTIKQNGGGCYGSEIYEKVEEELMKREIRAKLDEQERKNKREEELMEENKKMKTQLKQKDKDLSKLRRELQVILDNGMSPMNSLNFDGENFAESEVNDVEEVKGQRSEEDIFHDCSNYERPKVQKEGEEAVDHKYESIRLTCTGENDYAARTEIRREFEEERGFFAFFIKTFNMIKKLFRKPDMKN